MSSNLKVTFIDNSASQYDANAAEIKYGASSGEGKLFIGDSSSASYLQLKARSVKHVVNCDREIHGLSREEEVKYCNIDPDIKDCFEEAYVFIEEFLAKGKNVLVHCINGVGKSAAMMMYFVMKKKNVKLAEAHRMISRARNVDKLKIRPELYASLITAEKKLRNGTFSISLDGRKVVYLDEVFEALLKKKESEKKAGGGFPFIPFLVFVLFISGLYGALLLLAGK